MATGRFAPTPSGRFHVGNLRTALLAWLFAASGGSSLRLRIDDLDPATSDRAHERTQLRDLADLGISFAGPTLRQSDRYAEYDDAIAELVARELTYECFCSRREIREATTAPHEHLPEGAYPGTCRVLDRREREERARVRPAALRVRAGEAEIPFVDRVYGPITGYVDDFVVRRNDGTPSYNLATVIDDAAQEVEEVVRGADLLDTSARQIWLADVLGLPDVGHTHVPLMVNPERERLAKRDGAVTTADLADLGWSGPALRGLLAASIGLAEAGESPTMGELLARFDPDRVPTEPTIWHDPPARTCPDQKKASDAE